MSNGREKHQKMLHHFLFVNRFDLRSPLQYSRAVLPKGVGERNACDWPLAVLCLASRMQTISSSICLFIQANPVPQLLPFPHYSRVLLFLHNHSTCHKGISVWDHPNHTVNCMSVVQREE